MKSDNKIRNRTLTILFCLVALLTAFNHQRFSTRGEKPSAIVNRAPVQSQTTGPIPVLVPVLGPGRLPKDASILLATGPKLSPDQSDLLIDRDSELVRRKWDLAPIYDSPLGEVQLPELLARAGGGPFGSTGSGSSQLPSGIVTGPTSDGSCTPEQRSDPKSNCYAGTTETPGGKESPPTPVPEPSAILLLTSGMAAVAMKGRLGRG